MCMFTHTVLMRCFAHAPIARKAFWKKKDYHGCTYLIYIAVNMVHLCTNIDACSLIGTCAEKCVQILMGRSNWPCAITRLTALDLMIVTLWMRDVVYYAESLFLPVRL